MNQSLNIYALLLVSSLSLSAKADKSEGLNYKLLGGTSSDQCKLIGATSVEVKYKEKDFATEYGDIVVTTTNDGVYFEEVAREPVDAGRGYAVLHFDVGTCSTAIQINIVSY